MAIQYFTHPSRIEELRNCPGGHLLEEFAKDALNEIKETVPAVSICVSS